MPMTDEEFCLLCRNASYDEIKAALLNGAFVNAVVVLPESNNIGTTPLIEAVISNPDTEIINLLYEFGADPDKRNTAGVSALSISASVGRADVVKTLINAGADIKNVESIRKIFHQAAKSGYLEVVNVLLEAGVDVDMKDNNNETALIKASRQGCFEVVNALIAAGADVNTKNNKNTKKDKTGGETALMLAASHGHTDIVEVLLKAGAKGDKDEMLLNAVKSETPRPEFINTLLDCGADAKKVIAFARENRALMGSEVLRRIVRESR